VISKFNYFRNRKHLINVANLPCQNCYIEGQTQAAHSNQAVHGKGRGIKASDEYTAALCQTCHAELDSGARLNKEQRRELWQMAYQKTVNKLIENNLWPVDIPLPNLKI
jgi:hypothetical protein